MKIVNQRVEVEAVDRDAVLRKIEAAARTCYKSEARTGPGTAAALVADLVSRRHFSVLEHVSVTARFVTDRGISHELVRHRIASYSQESTRYCNYGKQNEIAVIHPGDQVEGSLDPIYWMPVIREVERAYLTMIKDGKSPQVARSILPNCLKTEVVMTANLREWRLVMEQRTSTAAHPDMRRLMRPLLRYFREVLPEVFPPELGDGSEFPPMAELLVSEVLCSR